MAIDWLTVEAEARPRSVSDLGLDGHPSATLVAIVRGEQTVMKPGGHEVTRSGDQLLIVGYRADIAEVRAKLLGAARG